MTFPIKPHVKKYTMTRDRLFFDQAPYAVRFRIDVSIMTWIRRHDDWFVDGEKAFGRLGVGYSHRPSIMLVSDLAKLKESGAILQRTTKLFNSLTVYAFNEATVDKLVELGRKHSIVVRVTYANIKKPILPGERSTITVRTENCSVIRAYMKCQHISAETAALFREFTDAHRDDCRLSPALKYLSGPNWLNSKSYIDFKSESVCALFALSMPELVRTVANLQVDK